MSIKRQIFLTFLTLFLSVVVFELSNIDVYVQNSFFDFDKHTWVLDRTLQPWKFIFYDGMKKAVILIAVAFLFLLGFSKRYERLHAYQHGMMVVLLSAILVPVMIGGLKKSTNMPCPKNEIHYGGDRPHTAVWKPYDLREQKMDHIACWPAGHASGGFALMSLFFLFKERRKKVIALSVALTVGWSMGIYKMLIGDHFLSHTFITMIIAWLCIVLIHFLLTWLVKDKQS